MQKIDWSGAWLGLLSRHHDLDLDPNWAQTVRNVDFYGGAVSKREGTQYVNGWGAVIAADWVQVPISDFILDVSHLDVDTLGGSITKGTVIDGSGFAVGDPVTLTDGSIDRTSLGTVISKVGNELAVSDLTVLPRTGDCLIARHPLNGTARVDGLFQATFRDGRQTLIAACGDGLFGILQAPAPSVRLPEAFPETTVDVTWGNISTGSLTTVETIRAAVSSFPGEYIRIYGAGVGGGVYEGRVITVNPTTRVISVTPPTVMPPATGARVILFPSRQPGDTHFVQHANLTTITAANTPPVKWNGNVVQRSGVLPPIAPVATPSFIGGPLVGAYTYRQKFRNSMTGQESEPGPEMSGPITYATQGGAVPLTTSPDPQVDQVRLYRTTSGGAGAWYFVAEVVNGTTVFNDTVPDDRLGVLMREFLDEVMPDGVGGDGKVTIIALWPAANRLIGMNELMGFLLFSDGPDIQEGFLKPEAWPPDNQIFLNYDDGDKPRAVAAFFDSLLAFKTRSVFRVLGVPPVLEIQPLVFRQDLTGIGVFNQKALIIDQDEVIFPAQDAFYKLTRYMWAQQGFQTERVSRAIDDEFARLTAGQQQKTHGLFFRQRRQLRIFMAMDGETEPNENLVYQLEGDVEGKPHGWSEWSVPRLPDGLPLHPFRLDVDHLDVDRLGPAGSSPGTWPVGYTASCVAHFTVGPDVVYVGSRQGDVLRMDIGTAEAGCMPYTFDYVTSPFAPAGRGMVARGRSLNMVFVPKTPASVVVTLTTQFAGGRQVVIPLSPAGGFQLDVSRLDIDALSGGLLKRAIRAVLLALGEYFEIRYFESSNTAAFRLLSFTLWFQSLVTTVGPEQVVQRL